MHGVEQETTLGGSRVLLYPLYHPAAALYTPAMLKVLEEDFAPDPGAARRARSPRPCPLLAPVRGARAGAVAVQLGLF